MSASKLRNLLNLYPGNGLYGLKIESVQPENIQEKRIKVINGSNASTAAVS